MRVSNYFSVICGDEWTSYRSQIIETLKRRVSGPHKRLVSL